MKWAAAIQGARETGIYHQITMIDPRFICERNGFEIGYGWYDRFMIRPAQVPPVQTGRFPTGIGSNAVNMDVMFLCFLVSVVFPFAFGAVSGGVIGRVRKPLPGMLRWLASR